MDPVDLFHENLTYKNHHTGLYIIYQPENDSLSHPHYLYDHYVNVWQYKNLIFLPPQFLNNESLAAHNLHL